MQRRKYEADVVGTEKFHGDVGEAANRRTVRLMAAWGGKAEDKEPATKVVGDENAPQSMFARRDETLPPGGRSLLFYFTSATAIVVSLQFIVVGLVPVFVEQLAIPLHRAAWLVSAFSLSAGIAGPFVTSLFSRMQPRRSVPFILVLFGFSAITAALFLNYRLLLIVRIGQGALLTPFLGIASATAALIAQQGRSGQTVGRVTLGTVIGNAFAVPTTLAFANMFGWRLVYLALSVLAIAVAVAVSATMPKVMLPEVMLSGPKRRLTKTLWNGRFFAHLALSVLVFVAMFASYTYIAVFMEETMRFPSNVVALALLWFGGAGVAGNWLVSRFVDRDALVATLIVISGLAFATGLSPLGARHWLLAVFVIALWGMAHNGAFIANLVRVMFAAGDAAALGAALNISAANVGIGVGALWGGAVVHRYGIQSVGLATVAVGLVALMLGWLLHIRELAESRF